MKTASELLMQILNGDVQVKTHPYGGDNAIKMVYRHDEALPYKVLKIYTKKDKEAVKKVIHSTRILEKAGFSIPKQNLLSGEKTPLLLMEYIEGEHNSQMDETFAKVVGHNIKRLISFKDFSEKDIDKIAKQDFSLVFIKKFIKRHKTVHTDLVDRLQKFTDIEKRIKKTRQTTFVHGDLSFGNIIVGKDVVFIDNDHSFFGNQYDEIARSIAFFGFGAHEKTGFFFEPVYHLMKSALGENIDPSIILFQSAKHLAYMMVNTEYYDNLRLENNEQDAYLKRKFAYDHHEYRRRFDLIYKQLEKIC